jgi:hypothetical protein
MPFLFVKISLGQRTISHRYIAHFDPIFDQTKKSGRKNSKNSDFVSRRGSSHENGRAGGRGESTAAGHDVVWCNSSYDCRHPLRGAALLDDARHRDDIDPS